MQYRIIKNGEAESIKKFLGKGYNALKQEAYRKKIPMIELLEQKGIVRKEGLTYKAAD